jgi:Ca2+:H+ antiporter
VSPKRRILIGGKSREPRRKLAALVSWPYYLTPLIPAAIVLELAGASPTLVFFVSAVGLIPPAALMGDATEELAARAGPGIGGILNVTFGNAPELIIAMFALSEGLHEVVKASLIGSVIGNILLVLGASMLVGGLKVGRAQRFETSAVRMQTRMLLVAGAAPVALAVYHLAAGGSLPGVHAERFDPGGAIETLSAIVAAILIVVYAVTLRSSLREYSRLAEIEEKHEGWSVRRSLAALAISAVFVGLMSEILVGSIAEASETIGLSEFFIGAVIVAIVGNAAEHWVAVLVAAKDKMDLSVAIAIGSSAQVALLVAPVLVLASFVIGPGPMPLLLNPFELGALVLSVLIAAWFTHDGRTTAREGAQLLVLYAALAVTFALV